MNNRKLMITRIVFTVLTAAAIAWIFLQSCLNSEMSSAESGWVTGVINAALGYFHIPYAAADWLIRKLAHFSEYAVMGALLSVTVWLYMRRIGRTLSAALPIGAFAAVCDELIQTLSQGRSCELRDMLIDFSGVLCAAALVSLILLIRTKRRKETT